MLVSSLEVSAETICKGSGTIGTADDYDCSVGAPIDGDSCCMSDDVVTDP